MRIEKGAALPEKNLGGRPTIYNWAAFEVGDSSVFTAKGFINARQAAYAWGRSHGVKFASDKLTRRI